MDLIKLHEIKEWARKQMNLHGLNKWTFVWDTRAVRRYGQCRYHKKEIGITKKLANINTFEESQDVVLHEIAHALVGRGHGHNEVWRNKCIEIGAKPEQYYQPEDRGGTVKQLKAKYLLVNKNTGEVYKKYWRKPKAKDWSTRWMRGNKSGTLGKLKVIDVNNTDQIRYIK
jgi:predicted SprT family Zn-dependent metalloprotease